MEKVIFDLFEVKEGFKVIIVGMDKDTFLSYNPPCATCLVQSMCIREFYFPLENKCGNTDSYIKISVCWEAVMYFIHKLKWICKSSCFEKIERMMKDQKKE